MMKRSLRSWLWRVPLEREVDEELDLHVEMRVRDLVACGMDRRVARDQVLSRIGDIQRLKRTCVQIGRKRDRRMRLIQWLEELQHDAAFAVRQMRTSPGFALVAILTLALGIGANSAMFALADATLIRPLPFADPHRLVMLWTSTPDGPRGIASPADLRDWDERNDTFEGMAAVVNTIGGGPLVTGPGGTVQSVPRQVVTAGFFDVLGVVPVAGRTFRPEDARVGANVVVMSEEVWRARFGGDPSVVGADVRLNGEPFTLVGVVPAGFSFTRPAGLWTLLPSDLGPGIRGARFVHAFGRMQPGISRDAAQADLSAIAEGLAREHPGTNADRGVTIEPLRDAIVGHEARLTSMLLVGVVGFVLLMCCANVANLLLARAGVRVRELTVRSALGAGRRRITRQLLTESLVLAALGGAAGIGVGALVLAAVPAILPGNLLPPVVELGFDTRVATFGVFASLLVGLLFGLVPVWQAAGGSFASITAAGGRTATGRGGLLRHVLVGAEIATAVLLLCGAGLLLRTLLAVGSFERGYEAASASVLTLDYSLPDIAPDSPYPTPDTMHRFYEQVERDVRALPAVASAGFATSLPLSGSEAGPRPFQIVGEPPLDPDAAPTADYQIVSPGYFETLGLSVVAGRTFDARDTSGREPVIIVNEPFARRFLAGRDPIGMQIALPGAARGEPVLRRVVGVARYVRGWPSETSELFQVYVPLAQDPLSQSYLVVRPEGGAPAALIPAIREITARLDPNVPVRRERTLEDLKEAATAPHLFRATLVATFAGLALALATIGVFGVLAYAVQQRWREIGIRIALGATSLHVLAVVLGGAARVIAIGAGLGLLAAMASARAISSFLFGVQPLDPVTFATVPALLVLTAGLATLVPALRAARVDPAVTLRGE